MTSAVQVLGRPAGRLNESVALGLWLSLYSGWYLEQLSPEERSSYRPFRLFINKFILPHYTENDIRYIVDIVEYVLPLVHKRIADHNPLRTLASELHPDGERITPGFIIHRKGALSNLKQMTYLISTEENEDIKCALIVEALSKHRKQVEATAAALRQGRLAVSPIHIKETTDIDGNWLWSMTLDKDQRELMRQLTAGIADQL